MRICTNYFSTTNVQHHNGCLGSADNGDLANYEIFQRTALINCTGCRSPQNYADVQLYRPKYPSGHAHETSRISYYIHAQPSLEMERRQRTSFFPVVTILPVTERQPIYDSVSCRMQYKQKVDERRTFWPGLSVGLRAWEYYEPQIRCTIFHHKSVKLGRQNRPPVRNHCEHSFLHVHGLFWRSSSTVTMSITTWVKNLNTLTDVYLYCVQEQEMTEVFYFSSQAAMLWQRKIWSMVVIPNGPIIIFSSQETMRATRTCRYGLEWGL